VAGEPEDGMLERHALRASIWKCSPDGWQIVFHQGTPTTPESSTSRLSRLRE
jgi:hypothetical protein